MPNIRPLPASSSTATASDTALSESLSYAPPHPSAPAHPNRHRLRAVAPDEVPPVAELLHSGATWLPAPPHTLPVLPGQPPMVGYLVLVPADRRGQEAPRAEPRESAVRVDSDQRTAHVQGRALDLTYLEFELLAHLVARPHRVHTRDQLVTTVWGYGHVGDGRTVDVHIARLRRKLGVEQRGSIVTVRRVGYKYVPVG
ncbi:winged helix-turn-helix domain-containing protein [Streptomyces sp. H27-D2]|uniref:winged helix-turn-helix domain-containing protein n=1 Tax=Streptomyces sp. H27-D2 TaxID=3046304 RepID=UPI002DB62D2E|nr:winged helix-turn-helix domain-containing protein [Streptomyces sp. H27-D2]MEC4017203.1 winged helix-turn-helix domain-containing protein [Streptomyces sp. H27-D2]